MDQATPTNVVAAGSLISPFWLQHVESVSQGAALILPIFALTWLAVQIVRAIWTWPKKDKK